ncbi:MAG: dTDP-4-dehydrorhamnose reductase [Desulfobacteraceae bacterium]|nr:MAG: dTDP-4-dehydrorhamnose reductase [Desulfobacteraceae bacterium]
MTILIIGCRGQVGTELALQMKQRGREIIAVDLPEIDITDSSSVKNYIARPEVSLVVNAAAYTAVDRAESERELAFAVNAQGPGLIAESCRIGNIPLIHISTDYVFDGTKSSAYVETDPVSPVGIYGKSKAAGDSLVAGCLEKYIILRTSWVCSAHGANFVKTMLRLGNEKETIRVVDDQKGCPTFAHDIAEAIVTIAEKYLAEQELPWGCYHYCGKGETTWFAFAQEIFRQAGERRELKLKSLLPIPSSEYPSPVKRPMNSVLNCSKIIEKFGIQPRPWKESLQQTLNDLYLQESAITSS